MPALPLPAWMRQGVRAYCDFEPLFFLRRRGGGAVDDEARKAQTHSEAYIKRLADAGFNLFVTHGYKGFGLEFEKREHDRVHAVRGYCHAHGLRLGTYCQVATLELETLRQEAPQAGDWIQVNAHGRPVYWNWQTYRCNPCYNQPGFRAYYKTVIRCLVEDLQTDFLHFDNLLWFPEPDSCHCPACQAAFRRYLEERYADPERAERRFGFRDFRFVSPPVCPANPRWLDQPVTDPLFQEWHEFRAVSLAGFMEAMASYAASLNPEVGIEANVGSFPVRNRYRANGNWYPYLARTGLHMVFNEDSEPKPVLRPRTVAANIQALKGGASVGLGVFGGGAYATADTVAATLAERLAFAPDAHMWAYRADEFADVYRRYFAFHRRHADWYHGVRELREAATLHPWHTMRHDAVAGRLAAILAGQCLLRTGWPFAIGFDPLLDALDDVRVLLLAGVAGLSDAQLRALDTYVRGGGGLVVTDSSGTLDDWSRIRPGWGLAPIFGRDTSPTRPLRVSCGRGRAVFLPSILPAKLPTPEPGDEPGAQWLKSRCWALPVRYPAVKRALEWAARGRFSARLRGPAACVANVLRRNDTGALVIHVVNFDLRRPARRLVLDLAAPAPARLTLATPDADTETAIAGRRVPGGLQFKLPPVRHYALLVPA